jgi:general secretion pathway protein H
LNKESGFTLIELTIVVLLLGLFSALVVPRLPGVGEDGLKSSARRIAGTVKYFFNEAALTGRPHRLEYNLDAL